MKNLILCIFLLVTIHSFGFDGEMVFKVEDLISKGRYIEAKDLLNNVFQNSNSKKDTSFIQLYQIYGDILHIEGDSDEALVYWEKSNKLRSELYSKDNYHIIWNDALQAYYHYDKINYKNTYKEIQKVISQLDNIPKDKYKEIEVYRIWNILALSLKQYQNFNTSVDLYKFYSDSVFPFYDRSIVFLEKNTVNNDYRLALTYHLKANAYTDLIHFFKMSNQFDLAKESLVEAEKWYDKSIRIHEANGNYLQLGKSYFVKGLANSYYSSIARDNRFVVNTEKNYNLALKYLEGSQKREVIKSSTILMCIKAYQRLIIERYKVQNKINDFKLFDELHQRAVVIWNELYNSYKTKNTNLLLSIYGLVPYQDKVELEQLKMRDSLTVDTNSLFEASQYLKYYDLLKWNDKQFSKNSISSIQEKLGVNQILLEFLIVSNNVIVFYITKEGVELKSVKINKQQIYRFNESILAFDYENYTKDAIQLKNILFKDIDLEQINEIIVCSDNWMNQLNLETLLFSSNKITTKDYRKLDYFLYHFKIQSIFYLNQLTNSIKEISDSISLFNPQPKEFSYLPYSNKFVYSFESENNVSISEEKIKKASFLNSKTSVLHLSAHGVIDEQEAMNSFIPFDDDNLYIKDIYNQIWKNNLIVLNTCNSGKGKFLIGGGVNGFPRAFLMKSNATVLYNLWGVDDQASSSILSSFYSNLNTNIVSISSLLEAKEEWIKNALSAQLAAPYYWGAHVLSGEEVRFRNTTKFTTALILFGILGVLVIFILIKLLKQ